ncbi:MAG: AAA family ATPase [Erysipelotrichaceae bacterium]|nr:AAA family ATPase [Erysipelotrichaceae bacterium]
MKTISLMSAKGGCSKTTTSINIAVGLSETGRVLLIDLDPQGNSSKRFFTNYLELDGICELLRKEKSYEECIHHTKFDHLDIIPSKRNLFILKKEMLYASHGIQQLRLKNVLDPIKKDYDYIIIDNHPDIDLLISNALLCSDMVIIPVNPDADNIELSDSIEGMNLTLQNIREAIEEGEIGGMDFRILLTMTDNTKASRMFEEYLRSAYGDYILNTNINYQSAPIKNKDRSGFVIEKDDTRIGQNYQLLVDEIRSLS